MKLNLTILKTFENKMLLILFFLWLSFANAQTSELDSLRQELEYFENTKSFDKNDLDYVKMHNTIAGLYFFKNLDSVQHYSQIAYAISKSNNFSNEEIIALLHLSHYYFNIGDNAESLRLLNESLHLAKDQNNQNEGAILNRLGYYHFDLGNHSEALKAYLSATRLAEKTSDKILLSIVKENIAILYIAQNDFQQALEIYKEVVAINNELGNEQYIAETKANIADLYVDLKDFENANLNIDYSIAIFEKNKSLEWLSSCYKTKGDIYLNQNNSNLALYWYGKSLELHENLNDDVYKAPLLNEIARAHLVQKKYTEAETFALSSLEISQKLGLLENSTNSFEILYQIKKEDAQAFSALEYHEKYKLLSDSISRRENLTSLGNLKTKLEFDKKQKDDALANEKELAKQNVYTYLALLMLVIFGFIIFLLRKQSKVRKDFNAILRLKNKALEKREFELNEINNTKDKLFSIIGHDLRGPINALGSILKMLKEKEITEEEFSEFIPKVSSDVDAISFTLNNLLSWGRTQMTGATSERIKIGLSSMINDTIKFLDESAQHKKISIQNTVSEAYIVYADKNQIDVVLRNLLSNAIKFTPKNGHITFSATDEEDFIQFAIQDNGVGMTEEFKQKVFTDSNTLVSTYGTANEKGTGLGLALCKEMVLKNEGEIWVESTLGKGSTFYIKLPKK